MMSKNKRFLLLAAAMVALPVTAALAASTTFNAVSSFTSSLTVDTPIVMSFADWFYGHTPIAGDTISLGTNGAVVPSANFATNGGIAAAGGVSVHGNAAFPIEVRCSPTATLSDGAGASIQAVGIKVTNGAGAAYPAGDTCDLVTPVVYNLVAGESTLKFGGQISGATAVAFVPGAYSTALGGGVAVSVDVVYQ